MPQNRDPREVNYYGPMGHGPIDDNPRRRWWRDPDHLAYWAISVVILASGVLLICADVYGAETGAETAVQPAPPDPPAPSVAIGAHLLSHHFPAHDWQNNENGGIYIRATAGPLEGLQAGAYRNTLRRTSVYLGVMLSGPKTPIGEIQFLAGAVSGYQRRWNGDHYVGRSPGALAPMVSPTIALLSVGGLTPRLYVIPGVRGCSSALSFALEGGF